MTITNTSTSTRENEDKIHLQNYATAPSVCHRTLTNCCNIRVKHVAWIIQEKHHEKGHK